MLISFTLGIAVAFISATINLIALARTQVPAPLGWVVIGQVSLFSAAAAYAALVGGGAWLSRGVVVGAVGAGLGTLLEWWLLPVALQRLARGTVFLVSGSASEQLLLALWLTALAAAGCGLVGWVVIRLHSLAVA